MKIITDFLRALLQIPFLIVMGISIVAVLLLFCFFDWLFNDNVELETHGYRNSF